ncbi:hypothetical protein [Loktanella sp. S4079]|uniref:hypothetical protein n=1 Tax=Loktanella sp. S4079 TaxID=579483 RepID=UPI0005FA30EC|nr:hypothetical protein [Loktanella sp. S4079]KJZ17862.1 hypothetical protein TW80_16610 [Loktanella sp. S4079]
MKPSVLICEHVRRGERIIHIGNSEGDLIACCSCEKLFNGGGFSLQDDIVSLDFLETDEEAMDIIQMLPVDSAASRTPDLGWTVSHFTGSSADIESDEYPVGTLFTPKQIDFLQTYSGRELFTICDDADRVVIGRFVSGLAYIPVFLSTSDAYDAARSSDFSLRAKPLLKHHILDVAKIAYFADIQDEALRYKTVVPLDYLRRLLISPLSD